MMHIPLTALVFREGAGFVSRCPELDLSSQGNSAEEARENLKKALGLLLEVALPGEGQVRVHYETPITTVEIAAG